MAKKIMLVEDDNNLREIYEARLSAEGYEIVAAENGEAALAMAAKERPDMIISDVMMPKISGFEMLDILRNTDSLKNTKIIMLTALGQSEDSQRADSLGADRYLVKSQVTLEDIVKAAHDLLDDPNMLAAVAQPASASVITPSQVADDTTAAAAPMADISPENTPAVEPAPETPQAPTAPVTPEPAVAPEPAVIPEPPVATEPGAAAPENSSVDPTSASQPTQQAEPAQQTVPAPDPAPAAAPSVISIPITDANGDDPAPAASNQPADDTNAAVSDVPSFTNSDIQANIQVAEEPVEESSPVAASADAEGQPGAPDIAASSEQSSAIAEPATSQASAIEDQINQFLQSQPEASSETAAAAVETAQNETPAVAETSPNVEENTPLSAQESPEYGPATGQPETVQHNPVDEQETASDNTQPEVQIPSIVANPEVNTADDSMVEIAAEGPADDVLAPEELNSFAAPIIDAPEGSSIPEPTSVPVEQFSAMETDPETITPESAPAEAVSAETNNANQLREAANDLAAASAPEAASTPTSNPVNGTNRMRTVSPLVPEENKPTIHQLLELEEAKNGATQAVGATEPPKPNVGAYNPSNSQSPPSTTDNPPIDPNSISL